MMKGIMGKGAVQAANQITKVGRTAIEQSVAPLVNNTVRHVTAADMANAAKRMAVTVADNVKAGPRSTFAELLAKQIAPTVPPLTDRTGRQDDARGGLNPIKPTGPSFLKRVFGENVEPVMTLSLPGKQPIELQVERSPNFPLREQLEALDNLEIADLGAAEPTMIADQRATKKELELQSHFYAGMEAAEHFILAEGEHDFTGLTAGSGNDKGEAHALVEIMDTRENSVKASTTSGGWVDNGLRSLGGNDQGNLNSAYLQGFAARYAQLKDNKARLSAFSQGAHATDHAMDGLSEDQRVLLGDVDISTMGGSSKLPLAYQALLGNRDPVPLARHFDVLRFGKPGMETPVPVNVKHNGKEYAKAYNEIVVNAADNKGN